MRLLIFGFLCTWLQKFLETLIKIITCEATSAFKIFEDHKQLVPLGIVKLIDFGNQIINTNFFFLLSLLLRGRMSAFEP